MARSVLLVEHEPRLLHFTAYQLRSLDLEPVAVESLDEAREIARERTFDLWIVDVEDVERRLGGQSDFLPNVPLIVVSDRERGREPQRLPSCQLLSKPFKLTQLSEAVNRALAGRASAQWSRPTRP